MASPVGSSESIPLLNQPVTRATSDPFKTTMEKVCCCCGNKLGNKYFKFCHMHPMHLQCARKWAKERPEDKICMTYECRLRTNAEKLEQKLEQGEVFYFAEPSPTAAQSFDFTSLYGTDEVKVPSPTHRLSTSSAGSSSFSAEPPPSPQGFERCCTLL